MFTIQSGKLNNYNIVFIVALSCLTVVLGGSIVFLQFPLLILGLILGGLYTLLVVYHIKDIDLSILFLVLTVRGFTDAFQEIEILGDINLSGIISIAFIGLSLYRLFLCNRIRVIWQFRTLPILLLLMWGGVSAIFQSSRSTLSISIVLGEIIRLVSILCLFWMVVAFVNSKQKIFLVLTAMLFSSLPPLIAGSLFSFLGKNVISVYGIPSLTRLQSFFAHPNNYAHYLLIIFSVTLAYQKLKSISMVARIELGLLQIALLLSLIFTFSRSAIIGLTLALLIFQAKKIKHLLITVISLVVFAAIFYYFFPTFIRYTLEQTTSDNPNISTLAGRYVIWQRAQNVGVFKSVIGYAPGSFEKIIGNDAHNDYLRVLFEYGTFGLFFFMLVEGFKIQDGVYLLRHTQNSSSISQIVSPADSRQVYSLGRAFLALTVSFLVISFVGNTFNMPVLQWYIYAFWGCVVSQIQILKSQVSNFECRRDLLNENTDR